jgi:hypothetical protein
MFVLENILVNKKLQDEKTKLKQDFFKKKITKKKEIETGKTAKK